MKKIVFLAMFLAFPLYSQNLEILKRIAEENGKIKTIEANIVQHIKKTGSSSETFRGRFLTGNKGKFRIDYIFPEKQVVLYGGKSLFWYYPDEKLLYVSKKMNNFSSPKVNPLKEINLIDSIKVNYLGYSFYSIFKIVRKFQITKNNKIITLWVDVSRPYVYKKSITLENGIEIAQEKYENYELLNGIYFPHVVDVRVRSKSGYTRSRTEYSNVKINRVLGSSTFKYSFPKDVERRFLDLK